MLHPKKEIFSEEAAGQILTILHNSLGYDAAGINPSPLGLTPEQIFIVIRKITHALPDYFFYEFPPNTQDEIKAYLVREFIIFQAQENWDDPDYPHNLINFIYHFIREVSSYKVGEKNEN